MVVEATGFVYAPERPKEDTFVGQKWGWTAKKAGKITLLLNVTCVVHVSAGWAGPPRKRVRCCLLAVCHLRGPCVSGGAGLPRKRVRWPIVTGVPAALCLGRPEPGTAGCTALAMPLLPARNLARLLTLPAGSASQPPQRRLACPLPRNSHLPSLLTRTSSPTIHPPPGSVAELLFDSRADASSADTSPDDKARATVYLSHLKGYKRMGTAWVECVSGCECERSVVDGTWEQQATLMQIHSFKVGGRQVAQLALWWPPEKQRRGL